MNYILKCYFYKQPFLLFQFNSAQYIDSVEYKQTQNTKHKGLLPDLTHV